MYSEFMWFWSVQSTFYCTYWWISINLSVISWSRLASPFMRSWRWWLTRRHGTGWERRRIAQKQSTCWSASPTGPSEKPSCCLSSASVKSWCLGASSLTRKALWQLPLKPRSQCALRNSSGSLLMWTHIVSIFIKANGKWIDQGVFTFLSGKTWIQVLHKLFSFSNFLLKRNPTHVCV